MKNKVIIAAIACLMLTACGNTSDNTDMTVSTESVSSVSESKAETTAETTASEAETTEYVSETEDAPSDIAEMTASVETFDLTGIISDDFDGSVGISDLKLIDNGTACIIIDTTRFNADDIEEKLVFAKVNVDDMSCIGSVEIPGKYYDRALFLNSGGTLAKIITYDWVQLSEEEAYGPSYTLTTIYDDMSIETTADYSNSDVYISVGSHKIAADNVNIIDADTGSVIVPGFQKDDDEYGFYTHSQRYAFTINDDAFVYDTFGYESLPGFGVYDFKTGENRPVADSKNLIPFGTDGVNIYSAASAWDGFPTAVYATDTEDLGSSKLFDITDVVEEIGYIYFSMPPSADFLYGFDFYRFNSTEPAYIKKYDKTTGEVTAIAKVPELNNNVYNSPVCFDSDNILYFKTYNGLMRVTISD